MPHVVKLFISFKMAYSCWFSNYKFSRCPPKKVTLTTERSRHFIFVLQ